MRNLNISCRQIGKAILIVSGIFLIQTFGCATAPQERFAGPTFFQTYDWKAGEVGYQIQQDSDGGYVLLGSTRFTDAGMILLLKIDTEGNISWRRTYTPGPAPTKNSFIKTSEGGFLVLGSEYGVPEKKSDTMKTESDIHLVKVDKEGVILWKHSFVHGEVGWGNDIAETSDGGAMILGTVLTPEGRQSHSAFIARINSAKAVAWKKVLSGKDFIDGESICRTADGNYLIAGSGLRNTSSRWQNPYILKIDPAGNVLWRTVVSTKPGSIKSVRLTADGGFVMTGQVPGKDTDPYDMIMIRTDHEGSVLWEKLFAGEGLDQGTDLTETRDGGYAFVGYSATDQTNNSLDVLLIKTDGEGKIQWNRSFRSNQDNIPFSVVQTDDGGYAIVGLTGKGFLGGPGIGGARILFVKTDNQGEIR